MRNTASLVAKSNVTQTPYGYVNDPNRQVAHSITLMGLMIGVEMTF